MPAGKSELFIGVDIGGTRTKYGLVDISCGEVIHSIVQPTEKKNDAVFLHQIGEVVREFTALAKGRLCMVNGIGFGVPGFTTNAGEVLTTYGFLEFMENYPIRELIEKKFQLPCLIDNDARVVSLGEALYGRGKGYNRVITLTLGTGLGFGLVVGESFTEDKPLAHMGGHLKITDQGEACYCGKVGCLEALVSSIGIINAAKKYPDLELSAAAVFEAAENDNASAVAVVNEMIGYLHTGIHNYVNLFAPDIIVLGGGIAKGLVPYIDKIKGEDYLSPFPHYNFQIAISELQELAGMLGSAALFRMKQQLI